MKFNHSTDWFAVNEFKSFDDPNGQVQRKEMVVPLSEYPDDFGLGPNPREPQTTSQVSKRIGETLADSPETFHLLNRGITILAKDVQYDNKSKRVRLTLGETDDEEAQYGILDGGNTNARINIWRSKLVQADEDTSLLNEAFINVQVLIPKRDAADEPTADVVALLNDIKQARNTSVQVKEKSLADARQHFDRLKEVLEKESFYDDVSWHEGDKGSIDALDVVSLLVTYFPAYSDEAEGGEPHGIYGHKSRALNAYLKYVDQKPKQLDSWTNLVPDLVKLFEHIETTLPIAYPGHYGRITEIKIYDDSKQGAGKKYRKTPLKSKFLGSQMKYSVPLAYVYPLYAALRVLAGEDDSGKAYWKEDPFEFWDRNRDDLMRQFKAQMENLNFESKKIGTSLTCYQSMRSAVSNAYKDELLKKAGISI